jgi:hypothetical protein
MCAFRPERPHPAKLGEPRLRRPVDDRRNALVGVTVEDCARKRAQALTSFSTNHALVSPTEWLCSSRTPALIAEPGHTTCRFEITLA